MTGYFNIEDCPKKYIDNDMYKCLRFADLMDKGLPPINGGVLEQSSWFINFFHTYLYENSLAKAELFK